MKEMVVDDSELTAETPVMQGYPKVSFPFWMTEYLRMGWNLQYRTASNLDQTKA